MQPLPLDKKPAEQAELPAELFREQRVVLTRHLTRKLKNYDDACDLVQDAYVRLLSYQQAQPVRSIKAFLSTTVSNLLKDRYRRRETHAEELHEPIDENSLVATTGCPECTLDSEQQLRRLEWALAQLDDKSRTALVLHRFHEQTYAQIAAGMGVTERSVHNYISRAISRLDASLRECAGE